jgi:hypothetical protein
MSKLLTTAIIILFSVSSYGQARVEAQFGGANFLGMTINSAYDISISEKGNQYLSPSFGIGFLAPGWDEPTTIINVGITYKLLNWGFGVEAANFLVNPIWGATNSTGFVDLIAYPHISYTLSTKSKLYFKLSGGAYFAFSKMYNYDASELKLRFEGDVIPGGGISVGLKL